MMENKANERDSQLQGPFCAQQRNVIPNARAIQ